MLDRPTIEKHQESQTKWLQEKSDFSSQRTRKRVVQQDRNTVTISSCPWGKHCEKHHIPLPPEPRARVQSSVFALPFVMRGRCPSPKTSWAELWLPYALFSNSSALPCRVLGHNSDFDCLSTITEMCSLCTEPVCRTLTYNPILVTGRGPLPHKSEDKDLSSKLCPLQ